MCSARSLLGSTVNTPAGDEFGTIKDVVLDFGRARVTAVFLAPHDVGGGIRDVVAIPIATLQWKLANGAIVFDATLKTTTATGASNEPGENSRVMRLAATEDIPS